MAHIALRHGANGIVFMHVLNQWVGTTPGSDEAVVAWKDIWGNWVAFRQRTVMHADGQWEVHKSTGRSFKRFADFLERWEEISPMEPHTCSLSCVVPEEVAA